MLKVFLVEDESVVRESLRDNIPWENYGFSFAGDASDGEMALPLIRKTHPDLLITDIKMPFMDGLTLCHIVSKEFPEMKMVVMSGYDDFEYARRAITEGVDQYLSKPITRSAIRETLETIRMKIEAEQDQKNYIEKYRLESREYEQMHRREFFEKIFGGNIAIEDIYEEANKLSIDISAQAYNLILFSIKGKEQTKPETFQKIEDEIMLYFLRYSNYILTEWSLNSYCAVVKGSTQEVEDHTRRGLDQVIDVCRRAGDKLEWYVAAGTMVERFSQMRDCFAGANHIFSCRFWMPEKHILTEHDAQEFASENSGKINTIDLSVVSMDVISGFLENGRESDIGEFAEGYMENVGEVLKSKVFRNYLALHIRFAIMDYIRKLGNSQNEISARIDEEVKNFDLSIAEVRPYLETLLRIAFAYQEKNKETQGSRILQDAIRYIDAHFMDESISLNSAASEVKTSSSYLSSVFSKELGRTFVEYLTEKRMEKAKELLADEKMHTADVAMAIGYKDPHYFSFVFRKTIGVSIKEFRARTERV